MSNVDRPFEKWGRLVALCRDSLRVLPGCREGILEIRHPEGLMFYTITNGHFSKVWAFDAEYLDCADAVLKSRIAFLTMKLVDDLEREAAISGIMSFTKASKKFG